MSNIVPSRPRLQPIQPITAEQVEIRDTLIEVLARCPACTGRGVVFFQSEFGASYRPCPCGGTDEDRIELNDANGAA